MKTTIESSGRMHSPAHPGDVLTEMYIAPLGVTVTKVARTRSALSLNACQLFGRSPANEAETIREQYHTHDNSTRSGPQRGFYDFPIDCHWAFLQFERSGIVRA